ncbi:thioesterase family protein [Neobacillus rhizophilus]|uniref:Thioesterase family protein n=1 Tax=Neobacillus rhizophilus TaxID=2833579 RepID=A0A942YU90_9BACI|nr:thioesterase family protein [Neobacillus rhizophilus]MBS4212909.1 thioesterase family protein [Neobacillus rhizophilus]
MVSPFKNPLMAETVHEEWIDYNGHMTDSAYAKVFSIAVDRLMVGIGISADFRETEQYSIYTLETHLCYLNEAHKGQELRVNMQLLDYDSKRLHVFFTMENTDGERLATSEQMLIGIDMKTGRPASFPPAILNQIEKLGRQHKNLPTPNEAGRKIGIRR